MMLSFFHSLELVPWLLRLNLLDWFTRN